MLTPLNLLRRQVTIARIFKIPLRIDYRWFLVFVVTVWLMTLNIAPAVGSSIGANATLALGICTTLLYFASIVGHELAHVLVARFEGIETIEIVLHPFGGLARMQTEPQSPRAEFRVALAGPGASFLIGGVFYFLAYVAGAAGFAAVASCLLILCFVNVLMAVFNLFPGYPLDGGRILRAYLWRRTGDIVGATYRSGRCGQVIALAFAAFGLFIALVRRDLITGVWTTLIALYLFDAAARIIAYTNRAATSSVTEAMKAPNALDPDMLISHFIDHVLPLHQQTSFPVARAGQLHGMLSLHDLRETSRDHWRRGLRVAEAMRPVADNHFITTEAPLSAAYELMKTNGIGALAVINTRGEVVGFLQQGSIRPA